MVDPWLLNLIVALLGGILAVVGILYGGGSALFAEWMFANGIDRFRMLIAGCLIPCFYLLFLLSIFAEFEGRNYLGNGYRTYSPNAFMAVTASSYFWLSSRLADSIKLACGITLFAVPLATLFAEMLYLESLSCLFHGLVTFHGP